MKTLIALLTVLAIVAEPVLSVVLISFISDFLWTLAQTLGAGNAPVGFVIDVAAVSALIAVLIDWALSLPVEIAEALKLEEDLR